jgi:hypothetical protein
MDGPQTMDGRPILELSLPYLYTPEVISMWGADILDIAAVTHYLCERFKMVQNKHFRVIDFPIKMIKTDSGATWDRIFCNDSLLSRIKETRFLGGDLKQKIYLGVKNNDNTLLTYYYKHHYIVKHNAITRFTIDEKSTRIIFENTPLVMDNMIMVHDPTHEYVVINNKDTGGVISLIHPTGLVEILDIKSHMDLHFLLPNAAFILTIYKQNTMMESVIDCNGYNRPQIRRGLPVK